MIAFRGSLAVTCDRIAFDPFRAGSPRAFPCVFPFGRPFAPCVHSHVLVLYGNCACSLTRFSLSLLPFAVLHPQLARDLLHPDPKTERRKCKLKRLVPHPNSYFMDVKCPGKVSIRFAFRFAFGFPFRWIAISIAIPLRLLLSDRLSHLTVQCKQLR